MVIIQIKKTYIANYQCEEIASGIHLSYA